MRYAWTMTETAEHDFSHLPPAAGRLGAVFARPKLVAVACIIALTALGWTYLALVTAQMDGVIAALCQPTFGAGGGWTASDFGLVAAMWAAMVLAMMLPSAAPMILTYAEIADTAARKGERIVSPFAIAAGYSVVWLGFALLATVAQMLFRRVALLDSGMASASALFSGAIFIGAGLYQFSALKHACLTQCRQPFPFFFAHWETTPRGVFRLGVKQGLFCLGCCWAMMAVMFAVGTMNVIWMAALAVVMTIEKITSGNRLTYGLGAALVAIGVAFVLVGFAAHWPPHAI
jgi:predicted metal-binding membrane protein